MIFEERYMGFKLVAGTEGFSSVSDIKEHLDNLFSQDKVPDVINVTYECYHQIRSSNDLGFERVWK